MEWSKESRLKLALRLLFHMREYSLGRVSNCSFNNETILCVLIGPEKFLSKNISLSALDRIGVKDIDESQIWDVIRKDISSRFPLEFSKEELMWGRSIKMNTLLL